MVDNEYKRHLAGQAGYVYDLLNSTAHHLQGKQKKKKILEGHAPYLMCKCKKKKPIWPIRVSFYYYYNFMALSDKKSVNHGVFMNEWTVTPMRESDFNLYV